LRAVSERKSGKQRREEIKQKRLQRAKRLRERMSQPQSFAIHGGGDDAAGMQMADRDILARHNNTYGELPQYYLDREFTCRDCGEEHVWTAKQQK
jgi:Probable zinc-ribbon domain